MALNWPLALAVSLCVATCFIAILLPPHKRGIFRGQIYKMPPGPPGKVVLGNLLPWLRARSGGALVPWVS